MAIVTGDLYKGFTFGDISSKAYGVYITQEAAYNAPDRDVEVVEIAGRNGAYILDKGRFRNITVSYKCGIALDDEHTFESAIRTFRNALSSKAGKYVRLEDDYNINEFRQAAFLGGIDVDMADRRAGEFTVSFDAMPQRFLKSGETAVSVASGGTITNPTLFESHPLLHVVGHGELIIGNSKIVLYNAELGDISIFAQPRQKNYVRNGRQVKIFDTERLDLSYLEINDIYRWNGGTYYAPFDAQGDVPSSRGGFSLSVTTSGTYFDIFVTTRMDTQDWMTPVYYIGVKLKKNALSFFKTVTRTITDTAEATVTYTTDGGSTYSRTVAIDFEIVSTGINILSLNLTINNSDDNATLYNGREFFFGESPYFNGISTKVPGELYIDTDIGEAYFDNNGSILNANNYVYFENDLPSLPHGETTVTYDVGSVSIVPRWWEV